MTHGNLGSNAGVLKDYWSFGKEDVLIHALPIFHTHGLFVAINVTLMAGSSLIFMTNFDTNAIINRYNSQIAMTVLADFLTIGHEGGGSFALSSNKYSMFLRKSKADARSRTSAKNTVYPRQRITTGKPNMEAWKLQTLNDLRNVRKRTGSSSKCVPISVLKTRH